MGNIKKKLLIGILISINSMMVACGSNTKTNAHLTAINEGKVAIASSEYDKAKSLFKLAIDEGGDEISLAKENFQILTDFLEAKKLFESKKLNESKILIDKISKIETYENLKNDIKKLKNQIYNEENLFKEIDEKFTTIESLIKDNNFTEVFKHLDELSLSTDSEEVLKKIEIIRIDTTKKQEEYIITKAKDIISKEGFEPIASVKFKADGVDSLPELKNKEVYHLVGNSQASPSEFYYDYKNNKMYYINQGMWFVVNDNYKNVTPKNSGSYDVAENHRKYLLSKKINFSLEDAIAIAESKKQNYGFIDIYINDEIEVVKGIKLYMGTGLTDTASSRTVNFWVGSDGNIYNFSGVSVDKELRSDIH